MCNLSQDVIDNCGHHMECCYLVGLCEVYKHIKKVNVGDGIQPALNYTLNGIVVCADCFKPIGDFQDDCGYFYSTIDCSHGEDHFLNEYVAKCRECNGPLTGDR